MGKGTNAEVLAGLVQELRRGTVVVACLAALRTPAYGYRLVEDLNELGLSVDGNTLYPLLRRLESQGLLRSEWNTEDTRPRKFYATTPEGRHALDALLGEWRALDAALAQIVHSTPEEQAP